MTVRDILDRLASGELTPDSAAPLLHADRIAHLEGRARLDVDRADRGGIPEVVLAGPKSGIDVAAIVGTLLDRTGQACVSRMRPGHRAVVERIATIRGARVIRYGRRACRVLAADVHPAAGDVPAAFRRHSPASADRAAPPAPVATGHVGLVAAGTADLDALEEARMVCDAAGCTTTVVADVGVAGLHRLFEPLSALLREGAAAIVVAAGMDGALASVVAGLVDVPVIGLPTSTGYGAGGKGEAALLAMLQTCAPGLTVVNVDNGVGAGAAAVRIARGR